MSDPAAARSLITDLHATVARQHALFVRILPQPIDLYTMNYYLVFRMIDTCEDAEVPFEIREEALQRIAQSLPDGIDWARAMLRHRPGVAPAYGRLFAVADKVLAACDAFPADIRDAIRATAHEMAEGMLVFLRASQEADAGRFLRDWEELDRYCRAVAGCVGELSTEIFRLTGAIAEDAGQRGKPGGAALGNYLQLVNVIRDRSEDAARRGRDFFPLSIRALQPQDQVRAVIAHARKSEGAIGTYLKSIAGSPVDAYCSTLFRIGRLHFDHFEKHAGAPGKPGALRLFAALPSTLRRQFIRHKLGR